MHLNSWRLVIAMRYKSRINRLEKRFSCEFADVLEWVKKGRYYDELSNEEKNYYCHYWGYEKKTIEEIELAIMGTLHFKTERKPTPPTPEQYQELIGKIEKALST